MKKLFRFVLALTATFSTSLSTLQAQLVGGSVFLKGQYVEAGICANGDFGAASPPAGYHPHTSTVSGGALGFVCDVAMDGWTTGTPAYMGDYFTPGSPFEGWNLQIGSIRAQAHSCAGFTGTGLTGANVAYTTSGSKVIGTWEGMFDSMKIRQVTTLDTLALYFSLKITLINQASVPKNDIYYLRSLDPDNDQSWPGGGFYTNNTIQYQYPNPLSATVVRAVGNSTTAPVLSLGTADTNARALIYGSWPIVSTIDLASVYNGTFAGATYGAGGVYNGDVAVGIAFRIAHLAPVDSASDSIGYRPTAGGRHPANESSISYFYSFSNAATDSALNYLKSDTLVTVPPDTVTTAVNTLSPTSEVVVYPNPVANLINISGLTNTDHIMLFDMVGKPISIHWSPTDKKVNTFSIHDIPTGRYLLQIKDQNGIVKAIRPIIKQ